MNILALDIATKTGWATAKISGFFNFSPRRGESEGMRLIRFKTAIREIIKAQDINLVVFERAAGLHKASIIVQSEMIGVLKELLLDNGIEYTQFSAKEIKKHATGNGNASKSKMVEAAIAKLNYKGNDDNEADALWIYDLAKNSFE